MFAPMRPRPIIPSCMISSESRAAISYHAGPLPVAAQQATGQQLDNFKNAFSVCLEARNYMVTDGPRPAPRAECGVRRILRTCDRLLRQT